MGQTKSKPFPSSLTSNSWRRLSDSDCIHLLSHPEYFDNQSINIDDKNGNIVRGRSGSTSTFFDAVEQSLPQTSQDSLQSYNNEIKNQNHTVIRSISMSSSTTPMYRNSMYPGCVEHHQDNCVQNNRSNSIKRPFNPTGQRQCSASPPPLPPPLTARIRPISMFAFEDGNDGDALSTKPMVGTPTAQPSASLKQIENINISLNDLLERVNTTETVRLRRQLQENQDEDDSAQTLMSKHVDEIEETDEETKLSPKTSKDPVYKESPMHEAADLGNRSRHPIRCSGLDCMCDRCIQNRFKLLNWLLPNCTRMNSERLLSGKPDGTFLVRKSEKFPGQYTLSFVCRRTVRHCLIMRSVYGFGLRWPYSFETLQQVIVHYSRHSLTEFNSKLNIHLKYPVFSA